MKIARPPWMPGPKLAALFAASFVFVVMLFIDNREKIQTINDERLHVIERLSATRARLEAAINIPVSMTRAIAVVYASHPHMAYHEFAMLAEQAKLTSPSILDIALFRDTTISHVYPLGANIKLIGLDFSSLPAHWPSYQDMMNTRQATIAGPLKLDERDGSLAVVVRVPAYRTDSGNDHFVGSVGAPFLLASLLREAGLHEIDEDLHVAIRGRDGRGGRGDVFYGDPGVFAMNPIVQKVILPGGEWEIAAYPHSGWGNTSQTAYVIRLLGFVLCLLAAFWAYGLVRHLQIRSENEQRLRDSEAHLKLHDSALNVASSPIVITDRGARIVWANQAFTMLTGYELGEAIGRNCGELVRSGHQDRQFYESMWKTILSGQTWHGEMINRRKDGSLYHDEMTITPVCGEDGVINHFVAMKHDISARRIGEEHLKNMAFYDSLTQLPNRRLLLDRLRQNLTFSKRSGLYGALFFLDLDNFKPLNDAHGHAIGDLLLIEVASRIANCVREEDTVARFGGDEFVVMLKELDADRTASVTQAGMVAEKVRAALAEPYLLEMSQPENGNTVIEHTCTSSIGIAMFVNHEAGAEEILKRADVAMYQAKMAGRNAISFHVPIDSRQGTGI